MGKVRRRAAGQPPKKEINLTEGTIATSGTEQYATSQSVATAKNYLTHELERVNDAGQFLTVQDITDDFRRYCEENGLQQDESNFKKMVVKFFTLTPCSILAHCKYKAAERISCLAVFGVKFKNPITQWNVLQKRQG